MRRLTLGSTAIALAAACISGPQPRGASSQSASVNEQFDELADAYFEETLQLDPTLATSIGDGRYNGRFVPAFSEERRQKSRALAEKTLAALRRLERAALDERRTLSYEMLSRELEEDLAGLRFPSHLLPVDQFRNFANFFAQLGSGTGIQPFKTVKDYDDFLGRMGGFVAAVDIAIGNMRKGIEGGVVHPRVLMEKVLPQLSAQLVSRAEQSVFYQPVKNIPPSFSPEDRERLAAAYAEAIRERLVPAYRRLHEFIRDEYLPKTRQSVALSALPDGRAWYEHLVRQHTTTNLTAEQIHDLGLAEVRRIHAEMEKVKGQVGFEGELGAFLRHVASSPQFMFASREEMLAEYRATQARIDAATGKLFDVAPKANYEIRPVESYREQSAAGGMYVAATPDGSRPGVFYLNTYEPTSRSRSAVEALLLHEGSPGHHFQISIQRELTALPRFRRFGRYTVYSEGWGLYAETLGTELGFYTDRYRYFGALQSELWRAIRLVLDTGIHAKEWTRERAIQYARENSAASDVQIVSEVERFIAIPGQALAYKIGEMKMSELRRRAEQALRPRFEIKAFHRAVLEDGAVPLDVLERKLDRWIAAARVRAD
jgi:uncharacterized protein (DUF885 family)